MPPLLVFLMGCRVPAISLWFKVSSGEKGFTGATGSWQAAKAGSKEPEREHSDPPQPPMQSAQTWQEKKVGPQPLSHQSNVLRANQRAHLANLRPQLFSAAPCCLGLPGAPTFRGCRVMGPGGDWGMPRILVPGAGASPRGSSPRYDAKRRGVSELRWIWVQTSGLPVPSCVNLGQSLCAWVSPL